MALALRLVLTALVAVSALWGALFLLYRVPGPAPLPWAASAAFGCAGVFALWAAWSGRLRWLAVYTAGVAALVSWFCVRAPTNDADWAPEVSRPLRAEISADQVTVDDVRDFTWRTNDDYSPEWRPETYRLAELRTVDLINSYWAGPIIAHTLLSFGLAAGRYLTFSIEIRRKQAQDYSDIAGFFREYELVYVAAEERDIVRLRTNVRREDVQLYRVKASPDQVRAMFVELLARANRLADHPSWYNTLLTNCTTELFAAARAVAPSLPFDWRVILSGYLPDYAYDQGLLDTRLPFPNLKAASHVSGRGLEADGSPDFSARIRDGVPDPNR